MHLEIHDDIRRAATLPAEFYRSPEMFAACRERIFARSWQMIVGAEDYVRVPGDALPFVFMEGFLEEPLVLVRDEHDQVRCLSNVCTHRGNLLVWHPQRLQRV
ncbi:MAG: Rieske 2Fe-2S domain-containing protein, partial [Bacteroidota bacterium]|nr:Rieske 2Fe-2S domain-containing protein [Bacteroidota bacterium]